jgi:tetratricopeptide (TPR) repeat protein
VSADRQALGAVRKTIEYLRTVDGVKAIVLTGAVDTERDRAAALRTEADAHFERKDFARALQLYRVAAERGDTVAFMRMAILHEQGLGTAPNPVEAVAWTRRAADAGEPEAQNALAIYLENGIGTQKDQKAALKWYRSAAEANFPPAQRRLGQLHVIGTGVKRDLTLATQWFRRAADQGMAFAQNDYAWTLASCDDPKIANGPLAVDYALKAYRQDDKFWPFLDTLGAAFARNGQYEDAFKATELALALIQELTSRLPNAVPREKVAGVIERQRLYRERKPYTDPQLKSRSAGGPWSFDN